MNTIFTTDSPEDYNEKLNLDDLYEKKKLHDLATTKNYNTILNRVHNRIKATSRQQITEQYCWFVVPEMMIGVPRFDQATCIAYIIEKLQTNGFKIRYTHPNLLFISWQHWVPDYVRTEIKKKTGVAIDGNGNIKTEEAETNKPELLQNTIIKNKPTANNVNSNTKAIDTYKPSGNLIYNNDIINALKNNLNK